MRYRNWNIYLLFALVLILTSTCTKDDEEQKPFPRIQTLEVTNISENGATFRGQIHSTSGEAIIEHGFVWSQSVDLININNNDKILLGSFPGTGSFEAHINTTLEKGKKYYVKAYIKTANYLVYGVDVSFVSLGSEAPIITDFEPKNATWGDTLTIKGKNFSWVKNANKVFFGNALANLVANQDQNDTTIKAIVPLSLRDIESLLAVELAGNKSIFNQDTFILNTPKISSIFPEVAGWGDPISIFGYFPQRQGLTYTVKFNEAIAIIDNISTDEIIVRVAENLLTLNSFVKIEINGFTIYCPTKFQLSPPVITNVSPNIIWKDRIFTISGKYFKKGHTVVRVNGVNTWISDSNINDTLLSVKTPIINSSGNYNVSVSVLGQTTEWENQITYFVPSISSVTPSIVTFFDTITINGNFLNAAKVEIRGANAEIIYNSSDVIKAIVPVNIYKENSFYNYLLEVIVRGPWGAVVRTNALSLKLPEVYSVSPSEGRFGDIISIYGDYFQPGINYNKINIGEVIYASRNRIDFRVGYVSSGMNKISHSGGAFHTFDVTNTFLCYSPYKSLNANWLNGFHSGFHGVYNGFGFNGRGNGVYRYDPSNDSWTTMLTIPTANTFQAFFTIDSMLFSVGGFNSSGSTTKRVYMYNLEANTYIQLNDFPSLNEYMFGFSINGKGYVGGGLRSGVGSLNEFWEYNVETDKWSRKNDLPSNTFVGSSSFIVEGRAYVLDENMYLWAYDPETDEWESKSPLPGYPRILTCGFTINGLGYIAYGRERNNTNTKKDLWVYNPAHDQWTRKYDSPANGFYNGVYFVLNDMVYLGKGRLGSGYMDMFFQYDPSLDHSK
jgi:hypothetical protein